MEIEKEVDWLAENILAYERGLRQWWVVGQSEGFEIRRVFFASERV